MNWIHRILQKWLMNFSFFFILVSLWTHYFKYIWYVLIHCNHYLYSCTNSSIFGQWQPAQVGSWVLLKWSIPYPISTAPKTPRFRELSRNSEEFFHILKEMSLIVVGAYFPKRPKANFKYRSHCCFFLSSRLSKTNNTSKNQQNVPLVCLKFKPDLRSVSQAKVGDAVSWVTSTSQC